MNTIMENLKRVSELSEGVRLDGENYIFDFNNDVKGDLINLKFNNKPLKISKTRGLEFHFAFKINASHDLKNDLLFKIKNKEIDHLDYELFLNKAILGLFSAYDMEGFDVIIIPESKGHLAFDLATKIKKKIPDTLFAPEAILKNPPSNVTVDYELAKQKNLSDDTIKNIERAIKSLSKDGYFKIKKINPKFRKFITNILRFNDKNEKHFYNKLVGGNVFVLDDYLMEGTTFKEINSLLSEFSPNKIVFYSLLY